MNRPEPEPDPLAAWADQALRQLPARPAPGDLVPRVLAEIRRRAKAPWYRRPWLQWPATHRWGSGVLLATSFFLVLGMVAPRVGAFIRHHERFQQATRLTDGLVALGEAPARVGHAILVCFDQVQPWVVTSILCSLAVAWLSTVGLGTACWRIARTHR